MSGEDEDFVDGGAALVSRPYDDDEWALVRSAWWWRAIAMWLVAPYAVYALTKWQRPSRQSVWRRLLWAVLMVLGAGLLVGLPAAVVFSRRWYWLYRTNTVPEDIGIGITKPDASSGYLAWIAVGGCALADKLTTRKRDVQLTPSSLGEPWASLLGEAAHAVTRIERAAAASEGPATPPIVHALKEATAGVGAAQRVALQAAEVEETLAGLGIERVAERLAALESSPASPDVDAAKRALSEQLATGERMKAFVSRLEGQLQRLCAQLGEAAARADELSVCPPSQVELAPGMSTAVDNLVAIRSALEAVERP